MIFKELIKAGIIHSCYPNSGFNSKNELIKFKQLAEGEFITVDFSTLFLGLEQQFWCDCGYFGCRKRIVGFDLIPLIYQEKYVEDDLVPIEILKLHPDGVFRTDCDTPSGCIHI